MEWLSDLKDKFSKRRIKNLERAKEYARDFVDMDTARKIGVIINVTDTNLADLKLIEAYVQTLRKRGKNLMVIELNFDKKSEAYYTDTEEMFVNPAKLNWLDYPNPNIESRIMKEEMDILMDFDNSNRMTSRYLCGLSRAKTRTGIHRAGYESCYELMINRAEAADMKALIKEFDFFLNMIDNGKRVKVKSA